MTRLRPERELREPPTPIASKPQPVRQRPCPDPIASSFASSRLSKPAQYSGERSAGAPAAAWSRARSSREARQAEHDAEMRFEPGLAPGRQGAVEVVREPSFGFSASHDRSSPRNDFSRSRRILRALCILQETVFSEQPSTRAASAWLRPWSTTRAKAARKCPGSPPTASSIRDLSSSAAELPSGAEGGYAGTDRRLPGSRRRPSGSSRGPSSSGSVREALTAIR
ncbi:MAG: hypothetical protein M0C28_43010 [Candidatus Moduliflexus flocculans]|nr:hypothetical protein [Candidatus Moduliflexus flocculans]